MWYAYGRIGEALFHQLFELMEGVVAPRSGGPSELFFFREEACGRVMYAPDLPGWRRAGQSICIIGRLMRLPFDADWRMLVLTNQHPDLIHWPIRLINRQGKEDHASDR